VISEYKGSGIGISNSVKPISKKAPKQEEKAIKPMTKNKQEKKETLRKKVVKSVTRKKEIVNEPNQSMIEQNDIKLSQNNLDEETDKITPNITASIWYSKWRENTGTKGLRLGNERSGQNIEVGYPNYKVNPKPNYPMIARRNGYEGLVLLRVYVLQSGEVGEIKLERSSGYKVLDKAALQAVKDWVFIPAKKNGVSISSWVTVPIRFQLSDG
jgi:TonB family protein